MKKHELQTPAILLDLDKLEHNIQSWQALCNENGKELWPMIKTHKSTALAKMQLDAGATGFLCDVFSFSSCVHFFPPFFFRSFSSCIERYRLSW